MRERLDPGNAMADGARQQPPRRPVVQRKLTVGSVDDPLEHEADRVADEVLRTLQRRAPTGGISGHDGGDAAGRIRRQVGGHGRGCPCCVPTTRAPRDTRVRRAPASAIGAAGGDLTDEMSTRIMRASSGGAPLDPTMQVSMESAFGVDMSGVRIHRNSALAPEIGARAFTTGRHVHFATGEYDTGSRAGLHTLSHELAHVVQQGGAVRRVQRKFASRMDRSTFLAMLSVSKKARSLTDHIPSTGLGRFDVEYRHDLGELQVTVKPYFEFCQTVSGGAAVPGGWATADEDDFVLKFKQQAEAAWAGKYRFVCTKSGYTDLAANVVINVQRERDATKAHFHHRIQKTKGMSTGIGREQASDRSQINVGNFTEGDKTVRPHDSAATCQGMASHDQGRLLNLIEAFQVNPITFVAGSRNTIDAASRARLDAFAAAAQRTERPGSVPVPLVALGKRNKREALEKGNPAQDRANAVKAYLDAKPFKYKPTETKLFDDIVDDQTAVWKSKKSKLSKDAEKEKLDPLTARQRHREAELDVKMDFTWTGDPYSILAHEFGHMLGNPDEYFQYGSTMVRDAKVRQLQSTGRVEDLHLAAKIAAGGVSGTDSHISAQEPFVRLAEASGTEIPEFGPKTSSIMSAGADVLPVHYTPLWEALGLITGDVLKKEDWSIV